MAHEAPYAVFSHLFSLLHQGKFDQLKCLRKKNLKLEICMNLGIFMHGCYCEALLTRAMWFMGAEIVSPKICRQVVNVLLHFDRFHL
jgi:hypothetical protein